MNDDYNYRILIDTNVLLWAIFKVHLSKENTSILETALEVCVSSVSILEVRIKQELGGLPVFDILENIEKMSFTILPLTGSQAQHYKLHNQNNKDPFDNSLMSIAVAENLRLMTSDKMILSSKVSGLITIDASKR